MSVWSILAALMILAALVGSAVVCVQKGKVRTAMFGGLVFGLIPIVVGAMRLAKPDSKWARTHYRHEKLRRSRERFDN